MTRMCTTTEEAVQRTIVEALRILGYVVLVTSRRRHRCRVCGAFSSGGDGCDRGIPDLLVSLDDARWLGMEVKGPRTRVSPEQRSLAADGRIRIVRSVEDALAAVRGAME